MERVQRLITQKVKNNQRHISPGHTSERYMADKKQTAGEISVISPAALCYM